MYCVCGGWVCVCGGGVPAEALHTSVPGDTASLTHPPGSGKTTGSECGRELFLYEVCSRVFRLWLFVSLFSCVVL